MQRGLSFDPLKRVTLLTGLPSLHVNRALSFDVLTGIITTLSGVVAHFTGFENGEFGGLKCILARGNEPIKSENQIIVRCTQPIKIEKPLQCLLLFSYSVGEGNILLTVL